MPGERLLALSAALIVGLALGALLAHLLRRGERAWTYGLLAFAPLALLPAVAAVAPHALAPFVVTLIASALAATGLGLHLQLEDLRVGGDHETTARARRRPLDRIRARISERPSRRHALLGEVTPIGRTAAGELVTVARGDARSGRHVLVPGATGAGKTTTLGALLVDHVVVAGHGAVVIEAKNDRALLDAARSAAAARGARLRLFSPEGPTVYDPLAHGSVDERSERLVAVEEWGSADADFYRQAASPFLRTVIRTLDAGPDPTTLAAIAEGCSPDGLLNAAAAAGEEHLMEEVHRLVAALGPDQARAVAGLHARLANLASSDLARRWLDPTASGESFDLRTAIERREVVYLRLDTDRTGNVGRSLAQMALLDLGAAAGALMDRGLGTLVCVDEFGALEASALERLFARGRAAGFSVALGTQTLADLSAAGPAVRERIGATISALVCHRIGEQADAEWIAQLIGAVPSWQTTIRTEGPSRHTREGTRTRGYRFDVNPSELQRLGRGEAYVARLDSTEERRARRVEVVPPWRRLPGPAVAERPTRFRPHPSNQTREDSARSRKDTRMNSITLVGVLTKDPRPVGGGERRGCRMRLAEANAHPDHPLYIDASHFGTQVEPCLKHLRKGSRVAVVGRLRFREWKRVDLSPRSEHWIAAERIDFLSPPQAASTGDEEPRPTAAQPA